MSNSDPEAARKRIPFAHAPDWTDAKAFRRISRVMAEYLERAAGLFTDGRHREHPRFLFFPAAMIINGQHPRGTETRTGRGAALPRLGMKRDENCPVVWIVC